MQGWIVKLARRSNHRCVYTVVIGCTTQRARIGTIAHSMVQKAGRSGVAPALQQTFIFLVTAYL